MATVAAVIASTHHPFYYRASTAPARTGPRSPTSGWPRSRAFRETLTGPGRTSW